MTVKLLHRTEIRVSNRSGDRHYYWKARCLACGKVFLTRRSDVVRGHVKGCGCLRHKKGRTNFRDYAGQTVGHLRIVKEIGRTPAKLVVWEAICTYEGCGNRVEVSSELLRGKKTSCGCRARKETRRRALAKYNVLKKG